MSRAAHSKASRAPRQRSAGVMIASWVGSVLSLGLVYLAGLAVVNDFGSFRSCNANSSGLSIKGCGKQGLNLGDVVLFGLFVLALCLAVSAWTGIWRMTRRSS